MDWTQDIDTNNAFIDEDFPANDNINLNDTSWINDIDSSQIFNDVDKRVSCVFNPSPKRKYTSELRTLRVLSPKRKQRKLCDFDNTILQYECCKQLCIRQLNMVKIERLRLPYAEKTERERSQWLLDSLNAMKVDQGNNKPVLICYKLEGFSVCQRAFLKVLGISTNKLAPLLRQIKQESASAILPHPNALRLYSSARSDSVQTFVLGLMSIFFDEQPDSNQWHCPIALNKKLLYSQYKSENEHSPHMSSIQTFYITISQYEWIKFPKTTRLGKCDECVELRVKLQQATAVSQTQVTNIQRQVAKHNALQRLERLTYSNRKLLTHLLIWQMIWDGYSGILIPHIAWAQFPKSWLRLAWLRLQISGLINHNTRRRTLFVSIAQQYSHDSNYSMNLLAIHIVSQIRDGQSLPPTMVFQSDNCWRENKNTYVFGFFAVLLLKKITNSIYFICLPQGHTHTDIDQENVPVAIGLKSHNLITGDENSVKEYIDSCYSSPPEVRMVKTLYDYRAWLAPYLPKLTGHSKPHVFRFTLNAQGSVVMHWRDYTGTDERWQSGADGEDIVILHNIPANKPAKIHPKPIDDKVIEATRQTYDKLSEEQQMYFEELFNNGHEEDDTTALDLLDMEFENPTTTYELTFLPPQMQQPYESATVVKVVTEAVQPEENVNHETNPDEYDDTSENDYDAPVVIEPVTNNQWIAREYRNISTADYGRTKRNKKPNKRYDD